MLDHVQVAIPPGGEAAGRDFYAGLLGLTEVAKPEGLPTAGVWFAEGLHLGVEAGFAPARRAHPALRVAGLDALATELEAAGHPVTWDTRLAGVQRLHTADPFGNRIELLEGRR